SMTAPESAVIGGGFSSVGDVPRLRLARVHLGNAAADLPVIIAQPTDIAVTEGQNAVLSVNAVSYVPPRYQWKRDGFLIQGATTWPYIITNALPAQSGRYSVDISNPSGTNASAQVMLAVSAPADSPGALDRGFDAGAGPDGLVSKVGV